MIKKKIFLTILTFDIGGAESQLLLLADRLSGKVEITVFALSISGPLRQRLEKTGATIKGIDSPYPKHWITVLTRIFWFQSLLIKELIRNRPHIVHSFLPLTNFIATFSCKVCRIPCLTSWRSLTNYRKKNFLASFIDKFSLYFSSKISCNSKAVLSDILKNDSWMPPSKTCVIYNGVIFPERENSTTISSVRKSLNLSLEDIAIVYVANLISYKGHRDLLKAFSLVSQPKNKRLKLFLVGGDRGIKKNLMEFSKKLKIDTRVFFLGSREDVSQLLKCMNIGVMASHEEGFSNALLEKLEAGLPVVATDVGGNKEALEGMKECYLVKSKNPISLSRGLERSINNFLSKKNGFGQERSDQVKSEFSVERMVGKYSKIYEEIARHRNN
jgi:glycosyltransferase involved in cell wall biosynthesis